MKKLKLDLHGLNAEVLTRSQLKQILGGDGGSGGSGGCQYGHLSCKADSDCGQVNAGLCCSQSDGNKCCWSVMRCV